MAQVLPQIKHIVVVMLENRSFDNLCGWIYSDPHGPQPSLFLPAGSPAAYDGLNASFWNPANKSYFEANEPPVKVPVVQGTTNFTVPNPDPEETFDNVTYQLYGPQGPDPIPTWPMQGFVVNYQDTQAASPDQIMQTYNPSQLPVLTALAQNFAISDAWFCSVPSQTWPNRSFVHAGTSNGNVDNGVITNPFHWNVLTIFNVLQSMGVSWRVYNDSMTSSLTRIMFPKLWSPLLNGHFRGFHDFQSDCAAGTLPQYSFIEPDYFSAEANDEHPPHDVAAGERFLFAIWQAISQSPAWVNTLLLITYDEHGGCYDHVLPPTNAVAPDLVSYPGQEGFHFDRFGVRVPAILISPYIQAGTVFRSPTPTPYDHTSVLATLRDWLPIPSTEMLPSQRIASAPTLAQALTLSTPRTTLPAIPAPPASLHPTPPMLPPNDLQKSIVAATAQFRGMKAAEALANVRTRQDVADFCARGYANP